MQNNEFTLIDAFNQFWTVWEDGNKRSLNASMCLYFYLCKIWNTSGRHISFRRQNNELTAALGISKPTLISQRNTLKQVGLIDFFSKGCGDTNITYQINDKLSSKKNLLPSNEKLKNFTSSFTSDFTSDFIHKQSKEKELFVVVVGEVKNFNYLQNLFSQDAGLKLNWANKFHPPEKFNDGIEQWLILNNGGKYQDFQKVRNHFLFWMPNYNKQTVKENEPNKRGFTKTTNGKSAGAGKLINALQQEFEVARRGNYDNGD